MALLPYVSLSQDTPLVEAGTWERVDGPLPVPVSTDLSGAWDYNTPVRLRRRLDVDFPAAIAACSLPEGSTLRLAAVWTTSFLHGRASGRQLAGASQPVNLDGSSSAVSIELELPSPHLAAGVDIRTVLTLCSRPAGPRGVHAVRPGSRLWWDEHHIDLEGRGARLPVCLVSFKDRPERFGGSRAAWMVRISGSALDQLVSAGVVVFLNSDHAEAFPLAGEASAQQQMLMRLLQLDVARQLLEHALEDEDFVGGRDYGEETLGASMLRLLDRVFPSTPVPDVAREYQTRRAYFQARLQHALDVLGGGQER
jgi:hypothetical protein